MAAAPRLPVVALPLAPRARQQLLAAGYSTVADLEHLSPDNLAAGVWCPRCTHVRPPERSTRLLMSTPTNLLPSHQLHHTPASGLSLPEAQEVLYWALGTPQPGWRLSAAASAWQLLQAERSEQRRRITTFCPELDALLGGGVATGAVTEFCE